MAAFSDDLRAQMMTAEEKAELHRIGMRLSEFVVANDMPGIDGLLMGFACGRMIGSGGSKAEVRAIFEQVLDQLPDPNAMEPS